MLILTGEETNSVECFKELTEEFSKNLINNLTEGFMFYKQYAVDKDSLIRKLHLGYTAMRPDAFDFVAEEFPWLEEFRKQYNLTKKLNFLETDGLDKKEFKVHIDGEPEKPSVMLNSPILNCTKDTVTYWVEPQEKFDPILQCENGTNNQKSHGATPHLPDNVPVNLIQKHSFTNKCALFRSDIYHGVINNSNKKEQRIMSHWWFPDYYKWEHAVNSFKGNINDGL